METQVSATRASPHSPQPSTTLYPPAPPPVDAMAAERMATLKRLAEAQLATFNQQFKEAAEACDFSRAVAINSKILQITHASARFCASPILADAASTVPSTGAEDG